MTLKIEATVKELVCEGYKPVHVDSPILSIGDLYKKDKDGVIVIYHHTGFGTYRLTEIKDENDERVMRVI